MRGAWGITLVAVAAALFVISPGAGSRADAPVPAEFQPLYDDLSGRMTSFEAELDAQWDGVIGPGRYSATLSAGNGNKSVALLTQTSWLGSLAMLDAYEAMGVEVIKLEVEYPVFTPAFQSWLAAHPPPGVNPYTATVANFVGTPTSFYNRLVEEIRDRGLELWMEHGTLFADYSPTPPGEYFADMRTSGTAATRARYTDERSAEAALLVSQLAPDYYTILEEPTTQNDNFGYFPGGMPLFDEDGWLGFVQAAAAEIEAAAPGSPTLLGAGSGTWEGFGYPQRFAPLTELDFVDLHIYPFETIGQDYLQNALDWADYVRLIDPGKVVTLGETWLYKVSVAELIAGLPYNDILGRDVYSFWEPLDEQYLRMVFKMMQVGDFEMVMPFWSQYYWAYLEHGAPELEGLNGPQLIALAGQAAGPNLLSGTYTGTGQQFVDLVALTADADGDGVTNGPDNCQRWPNPAQELPPWPAPSGDVDCDGYPANIGTSGRAPELFLGTDASDHCADTAAANDEVLPDAWPVDFNDDQKSTIIDISFYSSRFGATGPNQPYAARYDLNANNVLNIVDISQYSVFFGKSCSP